MKYSTVAVLFLVALAATEQVRGNEVTPVQKVIQMLEEMLAKGRAEKEAEIKVMNEYTEWVDDEATRLSQEIKTAQALIEKLIAEIEVATNDIADLTDAIAALDAEIATWEGDQKAA